MNIKVDNISVNRSGQQVLNDLSFELQDGHILSVMGKSGCGKTTLLRVIAGLGAVESGTITIGGARRNLYSASGAGSSLSVSGSPVVYSFECAGEPGIWTQDTRREQKKF